MSPVANVPEGYKMTEVGVIPGDWRIGKLAQLADIRSGIAKNSNAIPKNPITVNYLRVANVQDGYLDLAEMSQLTINRDELNRFLVFPGDMLMNEGGDIDKLGRGALWKGGFHPCVHQNHVFVVRCKSNLSPVYLNAWTSSTSARRYFLLAGRQTTNLASINKTSLGQLPISLPPTKAEQQAIAEALSDADALVESLEQLLVKKRQIKQGAMQELLTGQKRLPGFTGKWKPKRLGDIAHIKTGSRNNEEKVDDGEYPFFVRSATVERINSYSLDCEAILVPGEGGIGSIFHYINGHFDVHQRVYAITQFIPEICGKFIYLYMSMNFGSHAMQNSVKATVDSLRLPTFQDFEISTPPTLAEQTAIAAILSDMDSDIAALQAQLVKARQIKQGMMQELLTGRIRLVPPATLTQGVPA